MPAYLVTGATGKQGSGAAHWIREAGLDVHALVRDPSSEAAQALAAKGCKLFKGDFTDVESIKAAAQGCEGVFIVSIPAMSPPSLTKELEDSQNVVKAARAAGVKHAVSSTVCGLRPPEERGYSRDTFFGAYYGNKLALEETIKTAGFEHWTLLRPGTFASNFILPMAKFMAPTVATKGVYETALKPDFICPFIVSTDIGRFAAAAFQNPEKFHGQIVDLAAEHLTMAQYFDKVSKVAGKKVGIHYWSKEDVDAMNGSNLIATSQLNQNDYPTTTDLEKIRSWGVPMESVEEFFEKNKQRVVESVGGN